MRKVDVAIVGSGFAGSIMAMILRCLGKSVVMIEKGKHPRFAIGESSTPLANLLLEEIATTYNLPDLASFSKWGTWQAAHPEIACGLKRGFTFYKHEFGQQTDYSDRTQQLLVAASPHDRIADTHWYRPDFDAHMARKAIELGAELLEQARPYARQTASGWTIKGDSVNGAFSFDTNFLIDASGPRGFLFQQTKIGERESVSPKTEALFAHFGDVQRLGFKDPEFPFPVDDAAVHHVFDGGWIWILRFNNGITSAGVSAVAEVARELGFQEGERAWQRLLGRLPSVQKQFAAAKAITPFFHQPKVFFAARLAAGPNWAMLPSAAGFVDPLFSTGFVLTLLGITRLAKYFERGFPTTEELSAYNEITLDELLHAERLVGAAFRSFHNFSEFADIARIYFAAAIWAETLRRLCRTSPSFLLADHPDIRNLVENLHTADLPKILERYDLAGLTDKSRRNWHPARADDLFANAEKIPASRAELEAMLRKCGF